MSFSKVRRAWRLLHGFLHIIPWKSGNARLTTRKRPAFNTAPKSSIMSTYCARKVETPLFASISTE